jgi:catechol 2,3-dioxygenase-like lactoylglutathione lyase family enzyme
MKPDDARPILLVVKFDECFRFYRDVMGFKVIWGEEGNSYASFVVNKNIRLSIFKRDQMAKAIGKEDMPSGSKCQDLLALTFGVKDFDSTKKELQEKGVEFITPVIDRHDWGIRTIFLRDPDGTLLQIEAKMPKDQWTRELQSEAKKFEDRHRKRPKPRKSR